MNKKFKRGLMVCAIALALVVGSVQVEAQAVIPPPVITSVPGAYAGGPVLWPFLGAVAFGAFVIYANATGINFPLCGAGGMKCEYSYPGDYHYQQ